MGRTEVEEVRTSRMAEEVSRLPRPGLPLASLLCFCLLAALCALWLAGGVLLLDQRVPCQPVGHCSARAPRAPPKRQPSASLLVWRSSPGKACSGHPSTPCMHFRTVSRYLSSGVSLWTLALSLTGLWPSSCCCAHARDTPLALHARWKTLLPLLIMGRCFSSSSRCPVASRRGIGAPLHASKILRRVNLRQGACS
jgi:hypothetical protein